MTTNDPTAEPAPIPPDDPHRALTVATPGDPALTHLSVVGDTYTILLSGDDTGGRFASSTCTSHPAMARPRTATTSRKPSSSRKASSTSHSAAPRARLAPGPRSTCLANAPHQFHNSAEQPARLLCLCAPPGQEDFFAAV
jgi:hypothetical protein